MKNKKTKTPSEDNNFKLQVLQEEQKLLKNELTQLKGCQLQYFTLTVTGSAALFGLAARSTDYLVIGFAYLAPLAIILPCWWIFFDKATTITRIVGYYRVIERMIAEYPHSKTQYIGYERALAIYRRKDDKRAKMKPKDSKQKKIRHRYWDINWYTYTSLSFASCILSFIFFITYKPDDRYFFNPYKTYACLCVPFIGLVVVFLFAIKTRKLKIAITDGEYSYNENQIFWERIHRIWERIHRKGRD